MELFYSDNYFANIGDHIMPIKKFKLVKDAIEELSKNNKWNVTFKEPARVTKEDLLLAHTNEYVNAVETGKPKSLAESSTFPWSPQLPISVSYTNGGCIAAAKSALENKVSANLASGFHHASASKGEGFCTFNGLAVAIKKLQSEGSIKKAFILDADAHYGNGTASIFENDPNVSTYSICGSRWDVSLEEDQIHVHRYLPRSEGKKYLEVLANDLQFIEHFNPDLILYQAGADPFKEDPIGGLDLTKEDLKSRDRLVFEKAHKLDIPIMWVLAGGYTKPIEHIVDIHRNTFEEAYKVFNNITKKVSA